MRPEYGTRPLIADRLIAESFAEAFGAHRHRHDRPRPSSQAGVISRLTQLVARTWQAAARRH